MCTPIAAMAGAGAGLQAIGTVQQINAQNAQLKYQAAVAESNALISEYEGAYAKAQSLQEAQLLQKRLSSVVGSQRAAAGASGAVADSGSMMDLALDSVEQGKIDELAILSEGDMAKYRSHVAAANYRTQAKMYRRSRQDPFLPAMAGLMTGASNAMYLNTPKTLPTTTTEG